MGLGMEPMPLGIKVVSMESGSVRVPQTRRDAVLLSFAVVHAPIQIYATGSVTQIRFCPSTRKAAVEDVCHVRDEYLVEMNPRP